MTRVGPKTKKLLNSLSIAQKLRVIIGAYSFSILLLIGISWEGMWILSDVRAFIAGKTLWAAAHRQASTTLTHYTLFHNPDFYARFYQEMEIVYGDRTGFEALLRDKPDRETAVKGWVIGGVDPHDAGRAADTYLRFQWFPKMQDAMDAWRKADQELRGLDTINEEMKKRLESGPLSEQEKKEILARIVKITESTAYHERVFDDRFGEMARLLIRVLSISLALLGILLVGLGFMVARLIARNLLSNIEELASAARRVGSGDFFNSDRIRSQ